jgi:hypothetical protein
MLIADILHRKEKNYAAIKAAIIDAVDKKRSSIGRG